MKKFLTLALAFAVASIVSVSFAQEATAPVEKTAKKVSKKEKVKLSPEEQIKKLEDKKSKLTDPNKIAEIDEKINQIKAKNKKPADAAAPAAAGATPVAKE